MVMYDGDLKALLSAYSVMPVRSLYICSCGCVFVYKALAVSRDQLAVSARGQFRGPLDTKQKSSPIVLHNSFDGLVVVILFVHL